ncbi:hypothetical protein TorRG33x02_321990 [Trema orientale]|uniref:Retrotransposon Copia-like N-terminal domain-containing protein n=1 Tax=Trema orientale TaxID=63057 RepID=A0A2P5BGF8_TREOI|nr:hypothetical protein TorRG33x02_321990 [Trema orientale]
MASVGSSSNNPSTGNPTIQMPPTNIPNVQDQIIGAQPPLPPLPILPSMNQPFTIKLDADNYLIWKNQLLNVIIANGLEDFIDGSRPCPPRFTDPARQIVNAEYIAWQRFNRLIMSWIYASLTQGVMGQIVGYASAFEIWEALNQIYTSSSLAKITELRAKLQNLRKDGLTAIEYIQKHKNICNTLAAVGEPVSCKDHLLYLFGGLDREYNAFVTSITKRPDNLPLEEIYSLLLSYEFRLESQNASAQLSSLQANLAHLNINKKPYRPNFSNPVGHFTQNFQNRTQQFQSHPPNSNQFQPSILGKPQGKHMNQP